MTGRTERERDLPKPLLIQSCFAKGLWIHGGFRRSRPLSVQPVTLPLSAAVEFLWGFDRLRCFLRGPLGTQCRHQLCPPPPLQ